MVGATQCRDHLASDEVATAVTLGAIQALVVLCADILSTFLEESRAGQVAATHFREHKNQLLIQTRQADKQ